jgi:uncharacterized membrane protein
MYHDLNITVAQTLEIRRKQVSSTPQWFFFFFLLMLLLLLLLFFFVYFWLQCTSQWLGELRVAVLMWNNTCFPLFVSAVTSIVVSVAHLFEKRFATNSVRETCCEPHAPTNCGGRAATFGRCCVFG